MTLGSVHEHCCHGVPGAVRCAGNSSEASGPLGSHRYQATTHDSSRGRPSAPLMVFPAARCKGNGGKCRVQGGSAVSKKVRARGCRHVLYLLACATGSWLLFQPPASYEGLGGLTSSQGGDGGVPSSGACVGSVGAQGGRPTRPRARIGVRSLVQRQEQRQEQHEGQNRDGGTVKCA